MSSEIRGALRRDSCAEIKPRSPTSAAQLIRPAFVLHLSLRTNAKSVTGQSRYAAEIDSDESIRGFLSLWNLRVRACTQLITQL